MMVVTSTLLGTYFVLLHLVFLCLLPHASMSHLLNRSLEDVTRQDSRGSRSSPYSRSDQRRSRAEGSASDADRWQHDMYQSGSSAASSRYQASTVPTPKLLIQGLHWEVSEEELKSLFEQMGSVSKSFIKYDRSGRSTGTAIVIYDDVRDAERARDEFNGANAKGQPIEITFEVMRGPGRGPAGAGKGSGGDLRSRMDLLGRMGGDQAQRPANAPRGPAAERGAAASPRNNNVRSVSGDGGRRGGRGGAGRTTSGRGLREGRREPKTATDLDAELDAFMKAPAASKEAAQSVHAPQDGDVEMK
ncbi:unnamed protein product [Jaminaea pallidilutea]